MFSRWMIGIYFMTLSMHASAQDAPNIIIVTLDGMRWQEVFEGADTVLLNNRKFASMDSAMLLKTYFTPSATERRKLLMPFLWSTVAGKGQLFGNRNAGNNADVKNRYWFSYPGYNELFTGYPDTLVNSNAHPPNENTNVLEFLHQQPRYKNKVACFASWDAFKRIFNEQRSGFLVNDGFNDVPPKQSSPAIELLNKTQHLLPDFYGGEERLDAITGMMALEYMKAKHPKILFVSLGETDEWAHAGKYDYYLQAATHNDNIIQQLWALAEVDPFYKNNTTLIITTDHGRGAGAQWTSHHNDVPGSNEIWFAAMGNGIAAKGELKVEGQIYQQQVAQTIAYLAGFTFKANHPVAGKLDVLFRR